jgi:hypothetical protein
LLHAVELDGNHISQPDVSNHQDLNPIFTRNRALSEAFRPPLPRSIAIQSHELVSSFQRDCGPVRPATSGYGNPIAERLEADKQMTKRVSLVPDFLRPLSAPAQLTPENLSQWLPPRRELPFPKARASTKTFFPPSGLPSSSEVLFGASKRQISEDTECVAQGDVTPAFPRAMKRVAQRQASSVPQTAQQNISDETAEGTPNTDERDIRLQIAVEHDEEASPLAAKSAALGRPSTAPGLRSKATATAPRKRERDSGPDIASVNKHARIMVDKATQTQTGSGRDHTAPLALTTGTGQSLSSTIDKAIQPPESFLSDIEAFVSRHKHRPAPEELWQRPGYSEASAEERQALINDFICENLDNEDFIQLCEDTGNVWRRIVLEM